MGISSGYQYLQDLYIAGKHNHHRGVSEYPITSLLPFLSRLSVTTLWVYTFIAFLILVALYRLTFHPLSHIPGPFLARINGLWRTYHYFRGSWQDDILELHARYGSVVRIAPNEVSVVDAVAMKQLYGPSQTAPKTSWYWTWTYGKSEIPILFTETDRKIHGLLRKRVSAAYSMAAVLKFEKYIQDSLDIFIGKMREFAEKGKTVDMSEWSNALAFDIVGELSYGQRLGHMETGKDVDDVRSTIASDIYIVSNMGHLWGKSALVGNRVTNYISKALKRPNPMVAFENWSYERVMARKNGLDGSDRHDMLSHFWNMKSLDGTSPANEMEVLVEAINIVGAGADTTSIGMRSCLYYVCSHPRVYKRLQKELDEFHIQNGLSEPFKYTELQKIPYVKAIVSEATRMLPSIVYQLLREVPAGGMTIDGRFIPGGSVVGMSPRAQNRDQSIWGNDANEFRPERWLEDPSRTSLMESQSMTFGGSGPRGCIGKNIALVELSKFIAQVMFNFDVEFVDKVIPWKIHSYWFADQTNFHLRLRSRQPGNKA